jgi:precorrin-6A/cobalt-precorrin-6A reductase
MKRVLILGGTGDAAQLAARIGADPAFDVITSLAGRTQQPSALLGKVHIGGFGGAAGLATYLREQQIEVLIDATHPFAAQISWNAAIAAQEAKIPHLMLTRPAWEKIPGDHWIEVDSVEAAAIALPPAAKRVFLAIGRQQLAPFVALRGIWFLIRSIDPPEPHCMTPQGKILLDRDPFTLCQERQLLQEHQIDAIVSKNSGGNATYAKIIAARELKIPILMVQRPALPAGEIAPDVEGAIIWLRHQLTP